MRNNHYTLIFVIIFITFITGSIFKTKLIHRIVLEKSIFDTKITRAVDEAVLCLTDDVEGNSTFAVNEAAESFFHTLAISFGAMTDKEASLLFLYVPVLAVVSEDYYMISYCDTELVDGNMSLCRKWSEKICNGYMSENFQKSFEESFNYYISNHNKIAAEYGISHRYTVRYEDTGLYDKSISAPSLIIWFEGYPYSYGRETYDKAFLAGAMIEKRTLFFVTAKEDELVYHNGSCGAENERAVFAATVCSECEEYGAVRCMECFDY